MAKKRLIAKRYVISPPTRLRPPLSHGNTAIAVYNNEQREMRRGNHHTQTFFSVTTRTDTSVCGGGAGILPLTRGYK
jgi:hypothetical protein